MQLSVSVPVGMHAAIAMPLLGRAPANVTVGEASFGTVWGGGAPLAMHPRWMRAPPRAQENVNGVTVVFDSAAGEFTLQACKR